MGCASEISAAAPAQTIFINLVTLSIMKAIGVDAEKAQSWAISIVEHGESYGFSSEYDEDRVWFSNENEIVLRFRHKDGWHIDHDDLILPGTRPCSLLALCAGKHLRDVVNIPALQGLDISILEARDENGMIRLRIMSPDTLVSLN